MIFATRGRMVVGSVEFMATAYPRGATIPES